MTAQVRQIAKMEGHGMAVYALASGRSENLIFSGSADQIVAEWSLDSFSSQPFAIRMESTVYSLCHLPKRELLLIGTINGHIHVVDLVERKEIRNLAFHDQGIFHLLHQPSLGIFYACCADGSLSVWDAHEFALLHHIQLNSGKIRHASLHPDGSILAVSCGDGSVHLLETERYSITQTLNGHERSANVAVWHPNGKVLVSGGRDAHLRFWNISEQYKEFRAIPAHNFAIYGLEFSPDGKYAATASRDKTIKIWDATSFDLIARLDHKAGGHINSVNKILWTAYQNKLVSTGDDKTLRIWEVY